MENLHLIEISDIALPNNWGVGRSENRVIFVPEALIGDKVWTEIRKRKKSFSYGSIRSFTEKSPYRVEPECPHFGICGGCAFQTLSYDKQLEIKEKFLHESLEKIGKIDLDNVDLKPIAGSPSIYGYRNKMEYAFGESNGKTILGLRERSSPFKSYVKQTVELKTCPIFSAIVEKIFPVFISYAEKNGLKPYNPYIRKGFLRHLVIREGKRTGELMLILVTTPGQLPDVLKLAEDLDACTGNLKSFWQVENSQVSDVVHFGKKHLILGNSAIEEKMDTFTFRIHPHTFFQTNTEGAEFLYKEIAKLANLSGNEKILGLYCGSGPIEIFLSPKAKEIKGIDCNDANIANAEENCRINHISSCSFTAGYVEKDLNAAGANNVKYDLLILDPPRGGLEGKAIRQAIDLSIKRIIYVSCNPSTLSRDSAVFSASGYHMKNLRCVDLFPHTGHLESVALFEKV